MQIQATVFPELRHCYNIGSDQSKGSVDTCPRVRSRLTSNDCTANTTAVFGMVSHDVTRSPNLTRGGSRQERAPSYRSESDQGRN